MFCFIHFVANRPIKESYLALVCLRHHGGRYWFWRALEEFRVPLLRVMAPLRQQKEQEIGNQHSNKNPKCSLQCTCI